MRRAFTMVELLIYLALMSIFLVIFGQIFFSVLDTQLKSRAVSAVQQDELYLLSRFGHDIRRATAVTSPASAGEISSSLAITVNSVNHTYGASSGSLTLTVDPVNRIFRYPVGGSQLQTQHPVGHRSYRSDHVFQSKS